MQAIVADQQLAQSMLRAAEAARNKAVAQAQGARANDRDRMAMQRSAPGQQVWSPQITVNARADASPDHIAHVINRRLQIRSRL